MDMDALDIPRLRGVTHAYAFWLRAGRGASR